MTTPTLTITDRVQAGAAWLDEHRPGWWQRIDLDTLDLGHPCRCVLGQDFAQEATADGRFVNGYALARNERLSPDFGTTELGFSAADDDPTWDVLTAAWRELILARRAGTETTR